MILTITGPSASGKTTLLSGVVATHLGAEPLQSITTRDARESDIAGEYRYVMDDIFDDFVREHAFLQPFDIHGKRYGTRLKTIDRALENGIHIAALNIEGARMFREYSMLMQKKEAMRSIYLRVGDPEKLRERLEKRGDAPEEIERRIVDCRSWDAEAQTAGVRFRVIDSALPKEDVLRQALKFLDEPVKNWRPSF